MLLRLASFTLLSFLALCKWSKLVNFLSEMIFKERRLPDVAKFYSNSKGKFSRQKLGNTLDFMNAIKDKWLNNHTLTPDRMRRILKRSFFII
jgi:hypothetical protein